MPDRNWDPEVPQPHDIIRQTGRYTPALVISAILIIAGVFALIFIFQPWAHKIEDSTARHNGVLASISASAYNNNPGVQQSLIQEMENAIIALGDAGPGQRQADARLACKDAAHVIALPPGDKPWVDANCSGPDLSPGSQYSQ